MAQATPPTSDEDDAGLRKPDGPLRRGWTTGACATAATKAALTALLEGDFPDPVTITLPKGQTPAFALAHEKRDADYAEVGIIKDAGDDPDVTHGAMVIARVTSNAPGTGVCFYAGVGVGMVTKAGLPIPQGEPAINPVPRQMMMQVIAESCRTHNIAPDFDVTISVPGGETIAQKTWNPRLGIVGGISILGTTGVVHPFSCAAWIHSIHRGIDVARAAKLDHVLAATGSTSEEAAQKIYNLPNIALIDMGDFAGGLLKYVRAHPVPKLTIAGGFAKLTKLAQGHLDLHSARSQVDMGFLATMAADAGANNAVCKQIQIANTAKEALEIAQEYDISLPSIISRKALDSTLEVIGPGDTHVQIIIVDRDGKTLAQTGFHG
ncbi:MAG: cobalt-precorrin-5B (C(1))-methyltransferase [Pseudomonadota bacterium]